ncbi:hypothetical protein [Ekhidna sp.]|uniref:hypothetical protein n=1 Tax=Ekhidna sp. TaxID=2608089 RepID=UPI003B5C6C15
MLTRYIYILILTLPSFCFSQNPVASFDLPYIDFTSEVQKKYAPQVPVVDPLQMNQFTTMNQRQRNAQIMAEVDAHVATEQARKDRVNKLIDDAVNAMPKIQYERRGPNIEGRERFYEAFSQIAEMLTDSSKLDLTKAVYLTEAAYNPDLSWKSYQDGIQKMLTHISYKLESDNIKADDQVARNMALFSFFTDTLTYDYPNEGPVTSYPLLYDFDDFWGREDAANLFVSKLMNKGTGQCHSLPLLYLILAEQTGTDAHMALAPNHSYIKFQDEFGNWHNMELTNHSLTSDQFVQASGYITAESIQNKMYMHPLTKKEVIAQCLSDLAIYYSKKFGQERFVYDAARFSYEHNQKSITPHQLINNYYYYNLNYVIHQYKQYGLTKEQFERDEKAQHIKNQLIGSQKFIERVGYQDMPPEQYERWLNSVKEEQNKQNHKIKMRTLMGQIDN